MNAYDAHINDLASTLNQIKFSNATSIGDLTGCSVFQRAELTELFWRDTFDKLRATVETQAADIKELETDYALDPYYCDKCI